MNQVDFLSIKKLIQNRVIGELKANLNKNKYTEINISQYIVKPVLNCFQAAILFNDEFPKRTKTPSEWISLLHEAKSLKNINLEDKIELFNLLEASLALFKPVVQSLVIHLSQNFISAKRIQKEPKLAKNFVKECLRMNHPMINSLVNHSYSQNKYTFQGIA